MNTRLKDQLTEPEILQIACDIGLGLSTMHYLSPPLIHRDLKVDNVLISGDGVYKLCDFGSASNILRPPRNSMEFQILDNDIQSHTTAQYRAPEMVDVARGFPIDEKSDIWAFGVFIYMLCYYRTPFEKEGNVGILNGRYAFPPTPAYSDRLKRIIHVTLSVDPRLRPNIYQCLKELYSMRGLDPPTRDIYTSPTSTIWKDTTVYQTNDSPLWADSVSGHPSTSSFSPQDLSVAPAIPAKIEPTLSYHASIDGGTSRPAPPVFAPVSSHQIPDSTTVPPTNSIYTGQAKQQQQHPSAISASVSSKTVDTSKSVSSTEENNLNDEVYAETKYPTIEELSQSLEQHYITVSPTISAPKSTYPTNASYSSSFTSLPSSIPGNNSSMPINIAKTSSVSPVQSSVPDSSVYGSYSKSMTPWGPYQAPAPQQFSQHSQQTLQNQPQPQMSQPVPKMPTINNSYLSTSNFNPGSYHEMSWSTGQLNRPVPLNSGSISNRPYTSASGFPTNQVSTALSSSSYTSSSSSSFEDDQIQPVRSINLNRSNSTASIRRPPSALSRGRTPESNGNFPSNVDGTRLQKPRPLSLYVQPSDSLLDFSDEVQVPPSRAYSHNTMHNSISSSVQSSTNIPANTNAPFVEVNDVPTLIDPIVSDEKDNLKAMLTDVEDKGNMIMLGDSVSAAEYGRSSSQDFSDSSDSDIGRSPASRYPSTLDPVSSSDHDLHLSYVMSKSTSTPHQSKRMSLTLKNKINDAFKIFDNPRSNTSQNGKSIPKQLSDYQPSNSLSKDKGFSYSTDNLGMYNSSKKDNRSVSPEDVVRQASFMEPEDASQFERPKHSKYQLTSTRSAVALGRSKTTTRSSSASTATGSLSKSPAFTIQNRIQALINGKTSPPPRTATGYGKYTDTRTSFDGTDNSKPQERLYRTKSSGGMHSLPDRRSFDAPNRASEGVNVAPLSNEIDQSASVYSHNSNNNIVGKSTSGLPRKVNAHNRQLSIISSERSTPSTSSDDEDTPTRPISSNVGDDYDSEDDELYVRPASKSQQQNLAQQTAQPPSKSIQRSVEGKEFLNQPASVHIATNTTTFEENPNITRTVNDAAPAQFSQTVHSISAIRVPEAGTVETTSDARTQVPTPSVPTNLMDDRSPGLSSAEDWKEAFNKKYPSLA